MFWEHTFLLSLLEGFTNYYKFCWINNILNPLNITVNMMNWAELLDIPIAINISFELLKLEGN